MLDGHGRSHHSPKNCFYFSSGHAYVMHLRGMPFSPMVFLPFMGAVIATKEMPRDAWEDALIAAGGPVAGSIGAGAVAVAAHVTDSQLLYALADFGFMINLFNLLPIGSMDGGRWAGALSKYVGVAGVGLGGAIAYSGVVKNPLFYLIVVGRRIRDVSKVLQSAFSPSQLLQNHRHTTRRLDRFVFWTHCGLAGRNGSESATPKVPRSTHSRTAIAGTNVGLDALLRNENATGDSVSYALS